MNRVRGDRLTSIVLIVLIALYLWQASQYNANARLIPFIVGISALGFALVTLVSPFVRAVLGKDQQLAVADEEFDTTPQYRYRLALIIAWTVLLAAALIFAGFIVTVPVFLLVLFAITELRISLVALLITTALTTLAWVFTVRLLGHGWLDAPLWQYLNLSGNS